MMYTNLRAIIVSSIVSWLILLAPLMLVVANVSTSSAFQIATLFVLLGIPAAIAFNYLLGRPIIRFFGNWSSTYIAAALSGGIVASILLAGCVLAIWGFDLAIPFDPNASSNTVAHQTFFYPDYKIRNIFPFALITLVVGVCTGLLVRHFISPNSNR